jgi:hypothetical protein
MIPVAVGWNNPYGLPPIEGVIAGSVPRATPANFPDSVERALFFRGVGHGGVPAMTHKVITLEFIVPTALAIVLGIALSVCAVYLADTYLFPVSQLEADYSAAVRH